MREPTNQQKIERDARERELAIVELSLLGYGMAWTAVRARRLERNRSNG